MPDWGVGEFGREMYIPGWPLPALASSPACLWGGACDLISLVGLGLSLQRGTGAEAF